MVLNENLEPGLWDSQATVAILDDDEGSRFVIDRLLSLSGYRVAAFAEAAHLLAALPDLAPAAICLDLHLPGCDGTEVLEQVRRAVPGTPVVMLTGDQSPESVVAAMRCGAYDYVTKPVDRDRLLLTLSHAVAERRLAVQVQLLERPRGGRRYGGLFGRSAAMLELFRQMEGVVTSDVPVLLRGESGTGKARIARAIHTLGARRNWPFIEVNLSTTPEPLQGPMLFGYMRGASVGAVAPRRGLLDQAAGGTLFLRNVGDLGATAQTGLLMALESGHFIRVGGGPEVSCSFRLVASSARELNPAVAGGGFREALYFRIAVFDLHVPPLRERVDDIQPLATEMVRDHAAALDPPRAAPVVRPEVVDVLLAYRWPGNARELSNAMQRAVIAAGSGPVTTAELPESIRRVPGGVSGAHEASHAVMPESPAGQRLAALTRRAILDSLARNWGNAAAAARDLGIGRATLYRKMRAYRRETPDASV